jgi:hypothetical protein
MFKPDFQTFKVGSSCSYIRYRTVQSRFTLLQWLLTVQSVSWDPVNMVLLESCMTEAILVEDIYLYALRMSLFHDNPSGPIDQDAV